MGREDFCGLVHENGVSGAVVMGKIPHGTETQRQFA